MMFHHPRPPPENHLQPARVLVASPASVLPVRTRESMQEVVVAAAQLGRAGEGEKQKTQPASSYVASELRQIRELIEGYPTEALNRLVEESEAVLTKAQERVGESEQELRRSGFFDWLTGRTKILKAELTERQAELAVAIVEARQVSRMSQRLEEVGDLLDKRQPTVALRNLEYIKQWCQEDLKIDQPIKRLKTLLARP